MSNLRTEHQIEIDQIHDRQLAEKDAEIERLLTKHAKEQNVLLTSLEVTTVEIERLNERVVFLATANTVKEKLLTECADALEDANAFVSKRTRTMDEELWTRAREASNQ